MNNIMYFLLFSTKTAFFRLKDIFPECFLYRDKFPNIEPLRCLREDLACTVGHNCMEVLCKRLYVLFQEILSESDMVILYFKKNNNTSRLGAGVFFRNMEDLRLITLNPTAWKTVKKRGNVFKFTPTTEFFLSGQAEKPKEEPEKQIIES